MIEPKTKKYIQDCYPIDKWVEQGFEAGKQEALVEKIKANALLREEIKKVENPYKDRPQHRVTYRRLEDFRQKILRALEEK